MREVDRSIFLGCRTDIRSTWQALVLTDLVYKLIAFAVLTPCVGLLFRLFLSLSGRDILADEDILFFALSPTGIAAIIIVGAVSVGTLAFEQSALMTIMFGVANDRHIGIRQALAIYDDPGSTDSPRNGQAYRDCPLNHGSVFSHGWIRLPSSIDRIRHQLLPARTAT